MCYQFFGAAIFDGPTVFFEIVMELVFCGLFWDRNRGFLLSNLFWDRNWLLDIILLSLDDFGVVLPVWPLGTSS